MLKVLIESDLVSYDLPSIDNGYVAWSKSTAPHVGGLETYNLKTGEVLEVLPQYGQQNSKVPNDIYKNYVVWMSWRTGNGDIYGAEI
jgi:hypothetical protein